MARAGFQLILLLLAVPAQYLLSKWLSPTSSDREYYTRTVLQNTIHSVRRLFDWRGWQSSLSQLLDKVFDGDLEGECVAKEVFAHKEPNGYFSTSPVPRLSGCVHPRVVL